MKRRRYTAIIFGILAVIWACVLFFFSGQNGTDSSTLSRKLACIIVKWFPALGGPADFEPLLRKLAHFGIFAVEGFLLGFSAISLLGYARGAVISFGICAMMAVANEYHQLFSGGRSCEFRDMIIDSCGALTGVIAAAVMTAIIVTAVKHRKNQNGRLCDQTIKRQDR